MEIPVLKCRYAWLQNPHPWLLGDKTELSPRIQLSSSTFIRFKQMKPERVPIEWSSSSPHQREDKAPPDCNPLLLCMEFWPNRREDGSGSNYKASVELLQKQRVSWAAGEL